MHKLIFTIAAICLLSACSRHYQPMDIAKKARLVSELISSSKQCNIYKEKLKSSTIKDDDVDDLYHEALKAHCINKDA